MIDQSYAEIPYNGRRWLMLVLLLGGMVMLAGRALYLQVLDNNFLQQQASLRHMTEVSLSAHRGKILDRNGSLLAVSTPVKSVTVNPQRFEASEADKVNLAGLLEMPVSKLRKRVDPKSERKFAYLKRRVLPSLVEKIEPLPIKGLSFETEYQRYYPNGQVTAHLLGFTDIDDDGQEGLELAYQDWLQGSTGRKRMIRDGNRRIIEDVESIRAAVSGQDLTLTIDQRLQYIAYRQLKAAVSKHKARSGSVVILDTHSGEVLAMANQPSFNPNSRANLKSSLFRNRAMTDVFEPGSTVKPFVVACALEGGFFRPDSVVDTSPGYLRVGRNLVRDRRNYGLIDISHILQKSSNVGISKIGLSLPTDRFWQFYHNLGFGRVSGTGFPGEASGRLADFQTWRRFTQATLSYGYGLSTSALQLAQAYSVLANDGVLYPVKLLRQDEPEQRVERIMSVNTATTVRQMLEQVVTRDGTAYKARVPGFRIAGKTGTVKKVGEHGYSKNRYQAIFTGMAPASDPRLVITVVINEPSVDEYYGGLVAAPVFSNVMSEALRLRGISPDSNDKSPVFVARQD